MRIKRSVNALKKRRKIFKLSKGYFGNKSKSYRIARTMPISADAEEREISENCGLRESMQRRESMVFLTAN